jgi:hypothetical protein
MIALINFKDKKKYSTSRVRSVFMKRLQTHLGKTCNFIGKKPYLNAKKILYLEFNLPVKIKNKDFRLTFLHIVTKIRSLIQKIILVFNLF